MNTTTSYTPLISEELRSVIEGKGAASRIPAILHFWTNTKDFEEHTAEVETILQEYPEDAQVILAKIPPALESVSGSEWILVDETLKKLKELASAELFPVQPGLDGRYRLAGWYCGLFERHCMLRGIENALSDFYLYPDKVKKLYRALTDLYLVIIEQAALEMKADGILTNDDMGTQTAPMFGGSIFNEFFYPYYSELISKTHDLGMHFWLHSCGCIKEFLPQFIELGLDVIHPIQKYTMDEKEIKNSFGGKICIWSGLDVQRILPGGSPEDVRHEVRYLMDTWYRPDGRLIFSSGNRINRDCPVENLIALYDEVFRYGKQAGPCDTTCCRHISVRKTRSR